MGSPRLFIILFLLLLVPLFVLITALRKSPPPLYQTQHTKTLEEVLAATESCTPSKSKAERGVFGLGVLSGHEFQAQDLLEDLGIKWVRSEFHWSIIQRADGTFNWQAYDSFVVEMQKRDIEILGIINYIPPWIEDWETVYGGLERFSAELVNRYKPGGVLAQQYQWKKYGIRYWEVFNEPNLPGFGWLGEVSNPEDFVDEYAYTLAIVNNVIRQVDPRAIILLGGLSLDGMPPDRFWNTLYQLGAKDCFDVLAFHPYGLIDNFDVAFEKIKKEVMEPFGDERKPIWFNEFGTSDDTIKVGLIQKMFEQKDAADGFFWFSLRDLKSSGWDFGLVEYDFSKKPAYDIFKKLLKR